MSQVSVPKMYRVRGTPAGIPKVGVAPKGAQHGVKVHHSCVLQTLQANDCLAFLHFCIADLTNLQNTYKSSKRPMHAFCGVMLSTLHYM